MASIKKNRTTLHEAIHGKKPQVSKKIHPGVKALDNFVKDRYGEEYKARLLKKGIHPCFTCHLNLSPYFFSCDECEHMFFLCKKHEKQGDRHAIFSGVLCVYCTRKQDDTLTGIFKLLPTDIVLTEQQKNVMARITNNVIDSGT
jgi:hypothetical protein